MRTTAGWLVPLLLLASSGCLEVPKRDTKPAPSPKPVAAKPARPPAVIPDQVTEANAAAQADALDAEISWDEQKAVPAAGPAKP
jgi:hypothetical protein